MKSERYLSALAYATAAHTGQVRKETATPYITHPIAVSDLVIEFGGDEEQAIAALLHDVVEDCGKTVDEIADQFGDRVAWIVAGCTDGVSTEPCDKEAWRFRKEAYIKHLADADADTLLVSICDKVHNARCIRDDVAVTGFAVFDRFTTGYDGTRWYYYALLAVFYNRLGSMAPIVETLRDALERTYS